MRARLGVDAVVRTEYRRARCIGDATHAGAFRGFEDVQRAEDVDARAEDRILARGRNQHRREVHDRVGAFDGGIDVARFSDVTANVLDLPRREAFAADEGIERGALVVDVEDAHRMAGVEQGPRSPSTDESAPARNEDAHQAGTTAANGARSSPLMVSASVQLPVT